jgi:hypothetical protein
MREPARALLFFLAVGALASCGGGGGGPHFGTYSGVWRIEALDNVTVATCGQRACGFSGDLLVSVIGNTIGATSTNPDLVWTGSTTADGFVLKTEEGSSCTGDLTGQTTVTITVSGISDPTTDGSGQVSYLRQAACGDGSGACRVTASGTATHLSD